ncbi:MAG: hypothetical protein HYU78_09580 [Rhodocyclales bacterium]|nr:hypothetical protein [Rhodocyclales bacterium]
MCYIVLPQTPIRKLLGAAANMIELLGDGTLPAACATAEPEATARAVVAFDQLAETANAVCNEIKGVSPCLRYRREIMADTVAGKLLRSLVLHLGIGSGISLRLIVAGVDDYHKRIALDLIVAYANVGDNDPHFMALAAEIAEAQSSEVAA